MVGLIKRCKIGGTCFWVVLILFILFVIIVSFIAGFFMGIRETGILETIINTANSAPEIVNKVREMPEEVNINGQV